VTKRKDTTITKRELSQPTGKKYVFHKYTDSDGDIYSQIRPNASAPFEVEEGTKVRIMFTESEKRVGDKTYKNRSIEEIRSLSDLAIWEDEEQPKQQLVTSTSGLLAIDTSKLAAPKAEPKQETKPEAKTQWQKKQDLPYPQPKDTSSEISGILQSLIGTGQYNKPGERGHYLEEKKLLQHALRVLVLKDELTANRDKLPALLKELTTKVTE
jgi:hypothetical protein